MVGNRGVQIGALRRLGKRSELQRNCRHHALAEVSDGGREQRHVAEARVSLQFRQVLVLEAEAIELEGVGRIAGSLIVLDHRAATARIARDAINGQRDVGRQQAGFDGGAKRRDGALRPAAGVGDAHGRGDGGGLIFVHLGKAIGPAVSGAEGGRGVDDPGRIIVDQRHAFARRIVRQAEDGDVGGVEQPLAFGHILALVRIDRDQFEIAPVGQPLADLQSCGAGFAIDEDLCDHGAAPLLGSFGAHI